MHSSTCYDTRSLVALVQQNIKLLKYIIAFRGKHKACFFFLLPSDSKLH